MKYGELTRKKQQVDRFRPFPPDLSRNLDEWFKIELTFTSNAIEGNTLTRRETAVVIEKGLTVAGKSVTEHLEATNHASALDFVLSLVKKKPARLTAKDVLAIHDLILKRLDDDSAGRYRSVPVRISGSAVIMPNRERCPNSWMSSIRG